ncbi:MAG: alpha/beta hydrolase [Marinifilaceae bacterium]
MKIIMIIQLFVLLSLSIVLLGQSKQVEAYDIYSYVGKTKALADIADFTKQSEPIYSSFLRQRDIPYGLSIRETYDYFHNPAYDKADGVFIFIHGGYWQGGDKESYAFVGKWFLENNIDLILIEYDLTKEHELRGKIQPRVTMTAIAGEISRALDHIQTFISQDARFNPDVPVFLSGHSAGGHLATLCKDHPVVNGGVFPISGLFDLAPIAPTKVVGKNLQLDVNEIIKLSPINNIKKATQKSSPIFLYYGGIEMPELIKQSKDYYKKVKRYNHEVSIYNIEDADHFEILNKLFSSTSSPLIENIKVILEKNKLKR